MKPPIAIAIFLLLVGCAGPDFAPTEKHFDTAGKTMVLPDGTTIRRIKTGPPPVYPLELRKQRISGTVIVQYVVNYDGSVSNLSVFRSSDPGFNAAAVASIVPWRYEPYGPRQGGPVTLRVPVDFQIDD